MARKCKCKICGEQLTTDIAFKVRIKDKNNYYCNEQEYLDMISKKDKKNKLMIEIGKILDYEQGMIIPPILKKKINILEKFYPIEVIEECFIKNSDNIKYWWNLENKFNNEYGKISYIMRIIENTINDVYKSWKFKKKSEIRIEQTQSNTYVIDFDDKPKNKNKKDITKFLD